LQFLEKAYIRSLLSLNRLFGNLSYSIHRDKILKLKELKIGFLTISGKGKLGLLVWVGNNTKS